MSTSYKGHTWGKIDLSQTSLKLCTMDENPKSIFTVDYEAINNATINKNDIIIQTGAKIQDDQDCMCEIRFYVDIPKQENQSDSDDSQKSKKAQQGQQADQDKKEKVILTQTMYKKIIEKAKIGAFAGQSMLTLNQVNLAVPRGKYTIDFYQKNFRFHGQTYNFMIDYKNIMKGFLLPMENESQVSIIFQLHKDKPIYQGQTLYRNIVVQVKKDIEVEVKTRVKDKDKQKHPNLTQIKDQYSGPLFQVLMDIIKTTAQITLIAPDSKDFKSRNGQSCVKCGVKAQSGWLYFLKSSLIFIPKPVLYFQVKDIKKVEFNRLGANNKQFDMKVTLLEEKKAVEFMGIQRNELDILIQYFKSKNVRVEMEEDVKKLKPQIVGDDDDDEEDDGDFEAEGMDSQSEDDQSFEQESVSGDDEGKKKQKRDKKDKQKKQDGKEQKEQKQGEEK